MPPLSSRRQRPTGGQSAPDLNLFGARPPGRGGGLYDSPERARPAHARAAGRAPPPPPEDRQYDADGDGRGGLAGPGDPYDRPTHSQWLGAKSRLRQDKADGALEHVASHYRVLFGGHQVVRKGLRRSIADAYAAYVGQVVRLPEDTYGMALMALDRTFNPRGLAPGFIDQNLSVSPYATSPAKHAQIFNTACKIMRDLGAYVYDVSYYCPGELDQLREMRRPASAPRRESYKSRGARLQPGEPPLEREAVTVARRASSASPGVARRLERRPLSGPPNLDVSPITGAIRTPLDGLSRERIPEPPRTTASTRRAPVVPSAGRGRRPGGGGGDAVTAAVARSVSAALDTAAEAEAEVEAEAGGGRRGGAVVDRLVDRQRRDLRRLGRPGLSARTPPHLRVSKYYDHISPTQEMLQLMRERAITAREQRADLATAAAAEEEDRVNQEAAAGSAGTAAAAPPPPARRRDAAHGWAYVARTSTSSRPYAARRPLGHTAEAAATVATAASYQDLDPDPDPAKMDRISWIIETAYELGLAEALGLEGPPPYARSERLSPLDYRRRFYEAVYSTPERYGPYAPYAPPLPWAAALGPQRVVGPPWAPRPYDTLQYAHAPALQYEYDGPTVERLRAAAAQREWRAETPDRMYPRSMRVSP